MDRDRDGRDAGPGRPGGADPGEAARAGEGEAGAGGAARDSDAALRSELLRLLESFAGAGIALVDEHGRVRLASAGFRQILGAGEDSLEGRPVGELARDAAGRPLFSGPTPPPEAGAVTGSGAAAPASLPVELRAARLASVEEGYALLARDRREAERVDAYLVQSERLRRLGEMSLGVAHELRNLLSVIGLSTELMEARGEPRLGVIRRAAEDAGRILERVQRHARPESTPERPGAVELAPLVRDAIEFTRPRWHTEANALRPRIELRTALAPGVRVEGVESDLREVVVNLVLNAVDALPGGGSVCVACDVDEDAARLVVEDTGPGIPDRVRERVFEPFFSTKGSRGLGLGLSIVSGIVAQHGGRIRVDDEPGEKTRFEVRLPLASGAPEAGARAAAPAPGPRRPWRILVVEDEDALRSLVCDGLAADGHRVEGVATAEEAEPRLAAEPWDCVVTDLSLPGRSGLELVRTARARHPELAALLMTGWGIDAQSEALERSGIARAIGKPFRLSELRSAIAELQGARGGEG